jgi:hypothetical protein
MMIINDSPTPVIFPNVSESRRTSDYSYQMSSDWPIEVYNFKKRFTDLGTKRQAGLDLCDTEWCGHLDDDDIILPHHLDLVDVLKEEDCDIGRRSRMAGMDDSGVSWIKKSGAEAQMVYRRELAQKVGGFPSIQRGQGHRLMMKMIRENRKRWTIVGGWKISYIRRYFKNWASNWGQGGRAFHKVNQDHPEGEFELDPPKETLVNFKKSYLKHLPDDITIRGEVVDFFDPMLEDLLQSCSEVS